MTDTELQDKIARLIDAPDDGQPKGYIEHVFEYDRPKATMNEGFASWVDMGLMTNGTGLSAPLTAEDIIKAHVEGYRSFLGIKPTKRTVRSIDEDWDY
jgi:hypothetical protein